MGVSGCQCTRTIHEYLTRRESRHLDLHNGTRLLDKIKDAHSAVECLERLGKSEVRKTRCRKRIMSFLNGFRTRGLEAGLESCAASEAAHPYACSR